MSFTHRLKKTSFIRISIGLVYLLNSFLLTACSIFDPIKVPPMHYFTITASPANEYFPLRKMQKTILVSPVHTNRAYSHPRMLYTPACYQVQFFSRSRWVDSPGNMLQPLLANTLQNSGYFQVILNTSFTPHYDWILNTQLLSFQQEFTTIPSQFRIGLRAQLVNAQSKRIIATQNFLEIQPAPHDDPYGGALAANLATQKILQRINLFCLENL